MYTLSSLILLFFIILFLSLAIIVVLTYLISTLIGQPFVPTSSKDMSQILGYLKLQQGQKLLELGCGDGRFLHFAADNTDVDGTGYELNPLLALVAKIRGWMSKLQNYHIHISDIRKVSYAGYDVIYLFLFPSLIEQIQDKFTKECKAGTIVVSHGFIIPALHKNLENTLPGNGFKTYIYKLS